MKTRFHRWLLGIMLLLLLPGTLLACLLLIGAVGSGIQRGFESRDFAAIGIMLIPPALVWSGLWLLAGLGQGVHHTLRRKLLAFYLVVLAYCAFWLFSTASHSGFETGIFPNEIRIMGFVVLILPVLVTLFNKPEKKREWNPQSAVRRRHPAEPSGRPFRRMARFPNSLGTRDLLLARHGTASAIDCRNVAA